jgi:hypothetical protein
VVAQLKEISGRVKSSPLFSTAAPAPDCEAVWVCCALT